MKHNIPGFGQENKDTVIHDSGLSPGGQILPEMLSQRQDICPFALMERALAKPAKLTHARISPTFGVSYGLIKQGWFAKMQAVYLGIPMFRC